MIRTILVPLAGTDSDDAVLETALSAGRALGAHLSFYHVRVGAAAAAPYIPHFDFAMGDALKDACDALDRMAADRSAEALRRFHRLCARERMTVTAEAERPPGLSASWREEDAPVLDALLPRARHRDLIVAGRQRHLDGMPPELLEQLLVHSGRPVLIAPDRPPATLTGTVAVCWKETPEAARALAAAMPFLAAADRVVLLASEEGRSFAGEAVEDLQRELRWHGISAETRLLPGDGRSTTDRLLAAAHAERADLLVMGAYGHSRAREWVFGGVTQSILGHADLPVFLLH